MAEIAEEKKLIDTFTYAPEDCLDFEISADCKNLKEVLIDRASYEEIPEEAEGIWWGEVTFDRETCSYMVSLYYNPEESEENKKTKDRDVIIYISAGRDINIGKGDEDEER